MNYQIHYSKDLAQVLPSDIFALMQKYPGAWEVKRKKQMKQTAAKERFSVILYLDLLYLIITDRVTIENYFLIGSWI